MDVPINSKVLFAGVLIIRAILLLGSKYPLFGFKGPASGTIRPASRSHLGARALRGMRQGLLKGSFKGDIDIDIDVDVDIDVDSCLESQWLMIMGYFQSMFSYCRVPWARNAHVFAQVPSLGH